MNLGLPAQNPLPDQSGQASMSHFEMSPIQANAVPNVVAPQSFRIAADTEDSEAANVKNSTHNTAEDNYNSTAVVKPLTVNLPSPDSPEILKPKAPERKMFFQVFS